MARRRTVAVVTGSRADFGLLEPVMRAIAADRRLRLRVVVTGTHLSWGTWRDVTAAGFRIAAKVPMQRRGATGREADVAALGRGVIGMGRVFARIKPDLVLVLGDRIEALAAAAAAMVGGWRLAHIHGGDRAEGVADESMRHAVSKLAHLHFAATVLSRKRLVRMGEHPETVFNVGSPSLDGLRGTRPASDAAELLVVQHPVGGTDRDEAKWMAETLAATAGFSRIVFAPNGDPGSAGIREAMRRGGVKPVEHLGRRRFASLLGGAKVVVGNSSAGLIEAAVLGTPAVNIGPRQGGREKPASVIDCGYGRENVLRAIRKALKTKGRKIRHPYGDGRAGRRIARLLATVDLTVIPQRKRNAY